MKTGIDEDPAETSVKYCRLIEIIEEIFSNNEKMLIFTSWQKMTDIIVNDVMRRFGVYVNKIDGRVGISERQTIVDKFNAMDNTGVLGVKSYCWRRRNKYNRR